MTAAISGHTPKSQCSRNVGAGQQAKQAQPAQDALLDEFSSILDRIAIQLSEMEVPYGEIQVELKPKEQSKAEPQPTSGEDSEQRAADPAAAESAQPKGSEEQEKETLPSEEQPVEHNAGEASVPKEAKEVEEGAVEAKDGESGADEQQQIEEAGSEAAQVVSAEVAARAVQVSDDEAAKQVEPSQTPEGEALQDGESGQPLVAEAALEEGRGEQTEQQAADKETPAEAAEVEAAPVEAAEIESTEIDEAPQTKTAGLEALEPETATVEAEAVEPEAAAAKAGDDLADIIEAAVKQEIQANDAVAAAAKAAVVNAAAAGQSGGQEANTKADGGAAAMVLRYLSEAGKQSETQPTTVLGPQNAVDVTALKAKVEMQGAAASKAKALPQQAAARAFEKVEAVLKEVARSRDGKTISVRLDPPSLGRVRVDVTLRDGALHARITAEAPEVNQMLRDRAGDLQLVLRRMGMNLDRVSVSVGSGQGESGAGSQSQQGGRSPGRQVAQEDDAGGGSGLEGGLASDARGSRAGTADHWIA